MIGRDKDFIRQVRRRRQKAAWSQTLLAGRMADRGHNWHQRTVSELENGKRRITLDEFLDLADLLDIRQVNGWRRIGDEPTPHVQRIRRP